MNNPTYRQTFAITDNLVDRYGRMKPSAMLYCIQEVSGTHAAALGVGYEILAEKNLFWAILRTRVQVTRLPRSGETVTLETWPMPTSRVAYPRAAVAYDTQGNELFRSISVWVLMDSQSRNMVLPVKSGVEVIGSVQGLELPVPTGLPAKLLPRSRSRSSCSGEGCRSTLLVTPAPSTLTAWAQGLTAPFHSLSFSASSTARIATEP